MAAILRALTPIQKLWRDKASTNHQTVGSTGESVAARYLLNRGYFMLHRNSRNRLGEIDLVMEAPDKRTIVFVEVKTAESKPDPRLAPELRVGSKKQQKLTALAANYLRKNGLIRQPVRFDVVGVNLPVDEEDEPQVRHYANAFQSPW